MTVGLLGRKLGMSQIFDENGVRIPVTIIEAGPCTILQLKETERDGYSALQIGFDPKGERKANKPETGHVKKANVSPMRYIREFRVETKEGYEPGQVINVDIFKEGESVDITGVTKGRGFAGPIKRHGNSPGPQTHGSRYHRRPGSLGASSFPSRAFKNRPMAGHMGNSKCTAQNLKVVRTDKERNILMVKGSVPGSSAGYVVIRKSVKGNNSKKK